MLLVSEERAEQRTAKKVIFMIDMYCAHQQCILNVYTQLSCIDIIITELLKNFNFEPLNNNFP